MPQEDQQIDGLPILDESQLFILRLLAETIGSEPHRVENFLAKCRFSPSGCIIWMGAMHNNGYGAFFMKDKGTGGYKKMEKAHRASYRLFYGPIPPDAVLDHICRNRRCVNPHHLEVTDQRTNIIRGTGISARYAGRTHCKRGHELTAENIYFYKGKRNACRLCQQIRDAIKRSKRP